MTGERLDRLENMMEQLIRITGSTNAAVGDLKQHMATLDQRMDKFDQRMDTFDQRMDKLDQRMDTFDQRMDKLDQRMDTLDQRMNTSEQNTNKLHQRINTLISEVATKDDITRLEHMDHGIMDLLESTYQEVERNSGAVDILAGKWIRQESELQRLRHVK